MQNMIGDKYRIIREAGSGGGGSVFQVYDCRLKKVWAAKRIDRKAGSLEEEVLQSVEAQSLIRIVDRVEQEGECFLIMDWIEGESLQQRINRQGALSVAEAVMVGLSVCEALELLHTMEPPVLYLDCKPSNIMLGKDKSVRLVDFGSAVRCDAKLAVPIAASFGYAAPEQRRADPALRRADCRSDIYSLGKTLYAALGGQCPDRPPYGALSLKRVNGAIPFGLCQVVERCCEQDPEQRFQTVTALRHALCNYEKVQKRRKWLWTGMCMIFFILLILSAWELAEWMQQAAAALVNAQQPGTAHLKNALLWLAAACLVQKSIKGCFLVRGPKWEMKQSVLRTIKKQGVWIFLIFLLWNLSIAGQAAGNDAAGNKIAGKEAKQLFCLRDENFRKLLLRNGVVLEAEDSIYIELDPSFFQKDQIYEISITGVNEENGGTGMTFLYRAQ